MARRIIEPIQIKKRTSHECPQCRGPVRRVPRTPLQRMGALFVPAKRYCCMDSTCGWTGLLPSRQLAEERRKFFEDKASLFRSNPVWTLALLALLAVVALGLVYWVGR